MYVCVSVCVRVRKCVNVYMCTCVHVCVCVYNRPIYLPSQLSKEDAYKQEQIFDALGRRDFALGQQRHRGIVPRDAANPTTTTGTRTGEIDMGIICFRAPKRMTPCLGVAFQKRKIEISMEDVPARQEDVPLQIKR